MNYEIIKEVLQLVEDFDKECVTYRQYQLDLNGFKQWIYDEMNRNDKRYAEPQWEGKENGRSPESFINTLIVHMNRYAKTYSKSAMVDSDFSTQEEFIYLINLKAFGAMSKIELIKKNIQEKPVGIQIINRLIKQEWVEQSDSATDKRSKVIQITEKGQQILEKQMYKIRQATQIVAGNLSHNEKMELIRLLKKLGEFHHRIYTEHIDSDELLDVVKEKYLTNLIR